MPTATEVVSLRDEQHRDEIALAQYVEHFSRHYAPQNEYTRQDFDRDLNALVYRAMAVARQPLEKAVADAYARVPMGAVLG